MSVPTPEQLQFILESGILAPSADNRHPLHFEIDGAGVNVWYGGGGLPPAGGYKRVLALLSLGAVSENLTVAAGRYGIRLEPELLPIPERPNLVFRVQWTPGERHNQDGPPLWEAIPLRHTNRSIRYRGPGLSPLVQTRLGRIAEAQPGVGLAWLDGPVLRRQALGLMRLAEGERFRNRALHEELFGAIRFDVGWRRGCEEGLPPGALAIEPPLRPAFALLRHWPVMRVVNLIGGYRLLGWRAADLPCRFAPHLAAVTVRETDDGSVFRAGRTLQRVWLEITQQGMVLQPMAASALYALAGGRQVPDAFQQHLQQSWNSILPGRHPIMLFRLGRASPLPINAGRPPFETLVEGLF